MLKELETALAARLAPMQDEGFRVLGAPTDHQAVGRVFGKGEIRVAYQSRSYQKPQGQRIERRVMTTNFTIQFEVVVELQDVRLQTHAIASDAMERIVNLLSGFNPDGECGSSLYPIKDGFIGRTQTDALWIYSAVFGLDRTFRIEVAA